MKFGLDEILSQSQFNKSRRNKFSFPKSQRFPSLKKMCTVDFYDKPSIKSRVCGFGYGNKYDFFQQAPKNPGPSAYSINSQLVNKKRGKSFGIGRSEVKVNDYLSKSSLQSKTPHSYNLSDSQLNFKRSQRCFLISKHKNDSFIQQNSNPDPAKYQPKLEMSQISNVSKFKNQRRSVFGSSERFYQPKKNQIGPGAYEPNVEQSSKNSKQASYKIPKARRITYAVQQIEKSITPGPIYYVN